MKNSNMQKSNLNIPNKFQRNRISHINSKKIKKKYVCDIHSRFYYLAKGILISILTSIPIFLAVALAVRFTNFPEEYMPPAILLTVFISIVVAAFYATAMSKTKGWFNGTIIGFIYALILVLIKWFLSGQLYFNKDVLTTLLSGLLIGSVCGIAGLNLGDKIRSSSIRSNQTHLKQ